MRRPLPPVVKGNYPAATERQYRAYLRELVRLCRRLISDKLLPAFVAASAEQRGLVRQDASWFGWVEAAISRISLALQDRLAAGDRVTAKVADATSAAAKKPWQRIAEAQTGVDLFKSEPWLDPLLESWAAANAQLIQSIPQRYLEQVAQTAQTMVRQGRSLKQFKEYLVREYGLADSRAKLIARTEVAKLNGQISKARQEALGIPEYTWLTAADERVRASHRALQGKICRWDDPSVYRNDGETKWRPRSGIGGYIGDPGEDFQCRCVSVARVEAVLDSLLNNHRAHSRD